MYASQVIGWILTIDVQKKTSDQAIYSAKSLHYRSVDHGDRKSTGTTPEAKREPLDRHDLIGDARWLEFESIDHTPSIKQHIWSNITTVGNNRVFTITTNEIRSCVHLIAYASKDLLA